MPRKNLMVDYDLLRGLVAILIAAFNRCSSPGQGRMLFQIPEKVVLSRL
jgi:hypothetical protein